MRKLETGAVGIKKIGPYVGIVRPRSMLYLRKIGNLKDDSIFNLIF